MERKHEIDRSSGREKLPLYLKIFIILVIVLAVVYAVNTTITSSVAKPLTAKVQVTYLLDSSCNKCVNLSAISKTLKSKGIPLGNDKFVKYDSYEGKNLIEKFGIAQIPAAIISSDIDYYPATRDALVQAGAIKKSGAYFINAPLPPYRDLKSNEIVGFTDLIIITDKSCTQCYDVAINNQILANFGIAINTGKIYDVNSSEAQQLISKYSISKVPTLLLSPDAKYYKTFAKAWSQVGIVENDGWFVMTKPEVIGVVKDLQTNNLINSTSQS